MLPIASLIAPQETPQPLGERCRDEPPEQEPRYPAYGVTRVRAGAQHPNERLEGQDHEPAPDHEDRERQAGRNDDVHESHAERNSSFRLPRAPLGGVVAGWW